MPPHTLAAKLGSRRFTLIELLVVVAVIAILASLLLPALSRARQKVRTTACLNHFKQMALAIGLYTADYEDWFPQGNRHTSGWMIGLAPYAGFSGDVSTLVASSGSANAVDRAVPIFLCPETKSWYWRWGIGRNYGINFLITNGRPDIGNYSPRRKLNQLTFPARTMLAGDNYHYTPISWGYFYATILPPEISGQPDLRTSKHHQGSVNFLFPDGHAFNSRPGIHQDLLFTDTGAPGW